MVPSDADFLSFAAGAEVSCRLVAVVLKQEVLFLSVLSSKLALSVMITHEVSREACEDRLIVPLISRGFVAVGNPLPREESFQTSPTWKV